MSYKFTTDELNELLTDYNQIALKANGRNLPERACIWDELL